MSCVIRETLRLWPPVSAISRHVTSDFKINEQEIPTGSWIQVRFFWCKKKFIINIYSRLEHIIVEDMKNFIQIQMNLFQNVLLKNQMTKSMLKI